MTCVLIKKGMCHLKTETHKGSAVTGRDWSGAVSSQGIPKINMHHQKPEEAKKDLTQDLRESMALLAP